MTFEMLGDLGHVRSDLTRLDGPRASFSQIQCLMSILLKCRGIFRGTAKVTITIIGVIFFSFVHS